MKAVLGDVTVAEADRDDLISIEGNWYFPPSSVNWDLLQESPTPYTCPWKGECQYYSLRIDEQTYKDLAWAYPHPYPTAIERVGVDFSGYVAFDPKVEVRAGEVPQEGSLA